MELRHRHGSKMLGLTIILCDCPQSRDQVRCGCGCRKLSRGDRGTEEGDRISLRVLNFHTVPKCEGRCLESADGPLRSPLVTPRKSVPLYRERQASHLWGGGSVLSGTVLWVPSKGQIRNAQLQKEGYPRQSKGAQWEGGGGSQVAAAHRPPHCPLSSGKRPRGCILKGGLKNDVRFCGLKVSLIWLNHLTARMTLPFRFDRVRDMIPPKYGTLAYRIS